MQQVVTFLAPRIMPSFRAGRVSKVPAVVTFLAPRIMPSLSQPRSPFPSFVVTFLAPRIMPRACVGNPLQSRAGRACFSQGRENCGIFAQLVG